MLYHAGKLMYVTPAYVEQTRKKKTKNSGKKVIAMVFCLRTTCKGHVTGGWASQGVKQHTEITTWIFFLSLWSEIYLESIHTQF